MVSRFKLLCLLLLIIPLYLVSQTSDTITVAVTDSLKTVSENSLYSKKLFSTVSLTVKIFTA
jgi:hypothetical protein